MSGRALRALVVAVIASLALAAPIASARPGGLGAAPISNVVAAALASKGEATAWVQLKVKADLSAAFHIADWSARGQYVYDQLTSVAKRSQAGLLQSLAARGVPAQSFWIINAVRVTASAATFRSIAARSDVERIFESTTVELSPVTPGAVEGAIQSVEWGIDNINANDVWSTYSDTGQGVVVATIDTGVQFDHPALVNQYRGNLGGGLFNHNYNWWDPSHVCGNPSLAPCDNNSHGTHTMGTIVGDDGAGNQIGVAPGAKWLAAKGCESSSCTDTALLSSGQFMLAPTDLNGANPNPALRPNLVSNSWGGGPAQPWYQPTVDAWVASGIFPVFANGNAGPACGTAGSPGDYVNAYAVGAYDINNAIASFSSRGVLGGSEIKPNISAPGVNVRSSVPGNGYSAFSGTSMATPHVAGVVALMFSAAPSLVGQIGQTRQLLDQSAHDTSDLTCGGTAADNNVWGEGRIDALAAVAASPRVPVGTLAGTVTSGGNPVAGAFISATGPSSRTTLTNASGAYSLTLPTGTTYSVTASKFAYDPSTASPVSITLNATTTQDFTLVAAATHVVSGTVRDGASAAVAGATVSIPGTPIAPVTTTASGGYSFPAVPEGTFTAQADPPSRCLGSQSRSLTVPAGDVTGFDFTLPSKQDAFGYRCQVQALSYVTATDAVALTGDDVVATVALPFAFTFYGTPYSSANVSTNGLVSFTDTSNSWTNTAIPNTSLPNTAIYAYWDDLIVDSPTAAVYTSSLGSAPNRRFVIEWRNIRFFGDATRRVSFEVILNENGDVQALYKDIAPGDGLEMGNSATTGIENQAGTVALQYSSSEAVLTDGLAVRYYIPSGGGNTAPIANGDSATTNEDTAISIDVLGNDTDADGNPLSIAAGSVSDPPNGAASIVAGKIQYVPDANWSGTDTFTYRAFDGTAQSAPATVTVTVNPVNDAPSVAVVLAGSTSCAASNGGTISLALTDIDSDVSSLVLTRTTSSAKVLPLAGITFGGAGAARTMTATGSGTKGTSTISITVSDGAASSSITVTFRAGGSGKDTLTGGSGPDILIGNGGNDTLRGNAGIDLLCGGAAVDTLTGGTEADWFDGGASTDVYTDKGPEDLGPLP